MPKKRTCLYDWTSATVDDGVLRIGKYHFCHDPQGVDVSAGKTGRIDPQNTDLVSYSLDYLDALVAELSDNDPRLDEYTDLVNAAKGAPATKKKAPAKKKKKAAAKK